MAELNEEMKKMDTRTSREELNKLAQEAGRLGKSSLEDVMGFVRAAFKTLKTYMDKHGLHTIRGICSRWAPENENNTGNYIQVVSRFSRIGADEHIDFADKERMIKLVDAMAFMENGLFFNKDVIARGYDES